MTAYLVPTYNWIRRNVDLCFQKVLGRIHLVLNKTLTDDTSVKRAQIKTFLCLPNPILLKLGEVVVLMDTTTSPSFIKIGLKTKKFSHEPISGTFK